MAPLEESKRKQSQGAKEKVEIRDLQTLLRKSFNREKLQLLDYEAMNLLPLGENYCSVILSLKARVKRTESSQPEELQLVAKTITRIENPIVDWSLLLKKEVFVYAELMPEYRELEREAGIEEAELLDVLPGYMGHRYSLEEGSDQVDEDSLLLMENMKARGYYVGNKKVGLDVRHARLALTRLARYLALGIALKQKRPDRFAAAVSQARVLGINVELLNELYESTLRSFREKASHFAKHMPIIEASFEGSMDAKTLKAVPSEPWATITHGDFWVNNMLFHREEASGRVDDVKFVDFQTYLHSSPLKDVLHFLCASLDQEALPNQFDELLDVYYEAFAKELERLGCDTEPYGREEFEAELKREAIIGFPYCAMALKFFVHEVGDGHEDSGQLMSSVIESKCSDMYLDKLLKLVGTFERKGWL